MKTILQKAVTMISFLIILCILTACEHRTNDFNEEEKEWIRQNNEKIDALFGYDAPPSAFHNEEGGYVGMSVDFLKEIEYHSGLKFNIKNFKTWDKLIQYSKSNNNFIIVGIALTPQRLEYLSFTDALVKAPYVIVTNVNSDIKNIRDLKDKKVCSPKGYAVNDFITNNYPFIKPEFVKNDLEGLRAVSLNLYDAMLINQMNASFISENQAISNIKIVNEINYTNRLGAATSNQDEILFKILDKAVDKVSDRKRHDIYKKWLTNRDNWISRRFVITLLIVLGSVVIILFVLWLWLTSLRRQIIKKTHQLAEEEQLFKNLFYNHTAIKIIIDPITQKIYDANNAAANFYGWTIDELKTKRISEINALNKNKIGQKVSMVDFGNESHFEFKHKKANGEISDVEVYTNLVRIKGKNYIYSIIHDISEKKKIEQKSRILSRAVEQSPISIVVTDHNGMIEYINPAFTHNSGYLLKEALGKTPRILKSGEHSQEFYQEMWKMILSGKTWTGELVNKKKTGELYWNSKAISPIFNENNEIVQFVSVSENITEKRKMFEDLVSAKEKAEESEQETKKIRDHLELIVKKRTKELEGRNKELEHFNKLFINREFRIKELKDIVNELEEELRKG